MDQNLHYLTSEGVPFKSAELKSKVVNNTIVVRYEDYARQPSAFLKTLFTSLRLPESTLEIAQSMNNVNSTESTQKAYSLNLKKNVEREHLQVQNRLLVGVLQ